MSKTDDNSTHPAFLDLRVEPWNGPACDAQAEQWRQKHAQMFRTIRANMGQTNDSLNALTRLRFDTLLEDIKETVRVLYHVEGDPRDRQALIYWLGVSYAVADQCSEVRCVEGAGIDLTHMLIGKVMKYWAKAAWQKLSTPKWADEVFVDIGNRNLNIGYGGMLSAATACDDILMFLAGYENQTKKITQRNPRFSEFSWNKDTLNSCGAWTILAVETPHMVPEGLIEKLNNLQQNFVGQIPHQDIWRRATVAWEQKTLTEFTAQIAAPDEKSNFAEGASADQRAVKRTL